MVDMTKEEKTDWDWIKEIANKPRTEYAGDSENRDIEQELCKAVMKLKKSIES